MQKRTDNDRLNEVLAVVQDAMNVLAQGGPMAAEQWRKNIVQLGKIGQLPISRDSRHAAMKLVYNSRTKQFNTPSEIQANIAELNNAVHVIEMNKANIKLTKEGINNLILGMVSRREIKPVVSTALNAIYGINSSVSGYSPLKSFAAYTNSLAKQ